MVLLYRLEMRTFQVVDARPWWPRWLERWLERWLGPRRRTRLAHLAHFVGRYESLALARAAAYEDAHATVGLYQVTTEDGMVIDQFPLLGLVA